MKANSVLRYLKKLLPSTFMYLLKQTTLTCLTKLSNKNNIISFER